MKWLLAIVLLVVAVGCSTKEPPRALPTSRQECLLYALDQPAPREAAIVCIKAFPVPKALVETPVQSAEVKDPVKPGGFLWYTASVAGECASILLDYTPSTQYPTRSWCEENVLSLVNHTWHLVCPPQGVHQHTTTWRLDPNAQGYKAVLLAGVTEDIPSELALYSERAACQIEASRVEEAKEEEK